MTSIFINYLYRIKRFKLYLFTDDPPEKNEYMIPNDTTRVLINNDLIQNIEKYKIDIFIYQRFNASHIKQLNNLKNTKVIFYLHSSIFTWIYSSLNLFKEIYTEFKNSKYVVNIIPYENDYLFKKWGIRSFYLDNFVTYDYNSVVPSDLSEKKILMVGRANNKNKRFNLGIEAMKFIVKEVPDSQLIIISKIRPKNIRDLIRSLNLEEKVKFAPYTLSPELYFKKASLHFFRLIMNHLA